MPLPFATLVGFALGAAFAWIAAPLVARDEGPVVASRPFAIVAAFAAIVWLPVVGYFVAFHGDWSYVYLVAWSDVPSAIDLGLVLVAAAAVVAGFVAAVPGVRKRRTGAVVAAIVAPCVVCGVGLLLASRRLAVSGTYAQFQGEFGTEPIGASTLGKGVLLMGVVVVLACAWTVRALARMGARDSRPVR